MKYKELLNENQRKQIESFERAIRRSNRRFYKKTKIMEPTNIDNLSFETKTPTAL